MAFGSKFVGIEIGSNAIRGVVLRKTGNSYRVVAAEKIEPDSAGSRILDFPEEGAEAVFSPEASELLRRLGKGARKTSVAVSEVEILLRHLPIPRSAGENLQPLIRAVLAAPAEDEVTFTYRRLPKAAPAPDHDLVLVAASRGLKLRRLVAGLKQASIKVAGLTPHSESLLQLARTAAADIPPGTPLVSLDSESSPAEGGGDAADSGAESGGDTFVLLDEGGPLFAIAPDSDMKAVTFALIEEGDLLFARRTQLTNMTAEGGRPADGIGLIAEIVEEASRTLDLAKGTLKRNDLVPGDVRIFGRRQACMEIASSMTRKMGVPVRIVPAEGWGAVTVQAGVVFDPSDYALALGLAIAAAEEADLVVPPAAARVERLGVHGRMRIVAAGVALLFVAAPAFRVQLYEAFSDESTRKSSVTLSNYVTTDSIIKGRAVAYDRAAELYEALVQDAAGDGGIGVLASVFDLAPQELKFNSVKIVTAEAREKWVIPSQKKKITITGVLDLADATVSSRLLVDFAQRLESEKIASEKPELQTLGESDIRGHKVERFEISFVTKGAGSKDNSKAAGGKGGF